LKQESQELELFMTPQVLPQDLSISHDFLDQDSQVFHALAKKGSTRGGFDSKSKVYSGIVESLICDSKHGETSRWG
jgi:hypothetical protein